MIGSRPQSSTPTGCNQWHDDVKLGGSPAGKWQISRWFWATCFVGATLTVIGCMDITAPRRKLCGSTTSTPAPPASKAQDPYEDVRNLKVRVHRTHCHENGAPKWGFVLEVEKPQDCQEPGQSVVYNIEGSSEGDYDECKVKNRLNCEHLANLNAGNTRVNNSGEIFITPLNECPDTTTANEMLKDMGYSVDKKVSLKEFREKIETYISKPYSSHHSIIFPRKNKWDIAAEGRKASHLYQTQYGEKKWFEMSIEERIAAMKQKQAAQLEIYESLQKSNVAAPGASPSAASPSDNLSCVEPQQHVRVKHHFPRGGIATAFAEASKAGEVNLDFCDSDDPKLFDVLMSSRAQKREHA